MSDIQPLGPKNPNPATVGSASSAKPADPQEMKRWKTSLDFQTMFLTQMYKSMRQTITHDELTQPSFARETFTDMFDGEIAAAPTRSPFESGPMGLLAAQTGQSTSLAAAVYRTLQRNGQETIAAPTAPQVTPAAPLAPLSPLAPGDLKPLIQKAAAQYSLSPNLLQSVIHVESGNNPAAISPKGAKGLMQLMDATADSVGVRDSLDPAQNVMGGARYLRALLNRFGGDEAKALAGYNAGPGAVDRYQGVPPFPETQAYVARVLQHRDALDAQGEAP